jgi:Tol biopolymer transport system component
MRLHQRLVLSAVVTMGAALAVPAGGAGAIEVEPQPDGMSYAPAVSADGRWVAFVSEASNLLGGDPTADPNGHADIFLVDTQTSTIRLVSSAGVPADGDSLDVDISADGRYVVFETFATNIVPGDANGSDGDIVLFDAQTGGLTLVSRRGATGAQGDDESFAPTISADGTKVAFASRATNLIGNDTNGKADIFVRDIVDGVTSRVSTDTSGRQANNTSFDAAIAPGGGFVALSSLASNLVSADTNGARDVFLKNLSSGKMTRASVTNGERQASSSSGLEDISANGRWVVFSSYASNLVKGDDNNKGDVFVRDRVDGTTVRVSRRGATDGNGDSFGAAITDDGAYIVFGTRATNLDGESDGNGVVTDVFEYRAATKTIVRISVDAAGGWTDGPSYDAAIAGDGSVVAFASLASDIVAGDLDGVDDVFTHAWVGDTRVERQLAWWSRALPVA